MDLDHRTLRQYLKFNQERRGVEYKASILGDGHESKLTTGSMAMANKRDGGAIIIGYDAATGHHGITEADLATYDTSMRITSEIRKRLGFRTRKV